MKINVVGGGLAGVEAAWKLANRNIPVTLYEGKPEVFSPAHHSPYLAELVCSNSLKSNDVYGNACGLLKEEMRLLGSLTMEAAKVSRVPAGGALAVDRDSFSAYITEKIQAHPLITLERKKIDCIPEDGICVLATGPLTQGALAEEISSLLGALHFYDASAPIVSAESIDWDKTFIADRYGKGSGDYVNCSMNKEEYEAFWNALVTAERATLRDFEKREIFDGCMPVEIMASRGMDTLRFGMLKPVGLYDREGKRPYAVLQLRKEDSAGSSYNLVGFQTNLKFGEQKRVFSMIPALRNAEFLRYGVMHRNTYLPAGSLRSDFSCKKRENLYFAGQITGVEGYVESAMSGLLTGIHIARRLEGLPPLTLDNTTVCGALSSYIAAEHTDFQPMNANYGILTPLNERDKAEKKRKMGVRALEAIRQTGESI
ncbi:MAG: methylenetetrahydrofolate--tRNA-(uracil(54)-C(5))-methyltransferase (FADH(2)-oxidizing) TrmFO [Clostridia bacterium]|nr:methylenetetrahydrofolate--tRNA-(uracil(54)-C(5))-methyltransferase (FADH(2)-oxidizing) TrmFO [Clostridia bacterium]